MANFPSSGVGLTVDNNNFQNLCQTIGSNIQKISQNVFTMSKMVNQLQTPQDTPALRNQMKEIQHFTQQLAKITSGMLMELMKMPIPDQPANKLMRDQLSDKYMSTLNAFQSIQRSVAQKTKEDVKKTRAQNVTVGDPFALNKSTKTDLLDMNDENIYQKEQMQMQSEQQTRELEEREQDIRQLENDILDVNQIFKELGSMIHDQGTIVDSIESNVEHTTYNVEAATQELQHASNYKNKLRKKKIYLAVILIIIISIIIIIFASR